MKKFLLLLLIAFTGLLSNAQGWRHGEKEVKVLLETPRKAHELKSFNFNGDFHEQTATLYLTPAELEILSRAGFTYEIIIDDLNTYYEGFWGRNEAYHTYQEIIDLADSLVTHFPDICTKHIFGTSMGGRQLAALKISDNANLDENEAEIFFDGGIHGDEIGASENVIRFARDLCLAYGEDAYITDLIDNREIWLYLMVNPDGRVNMSRYNNNGVDLNRDWGYMWNGEGSSTDVYSQQESKALRECSFNNQFVVHTTYHSGIEYISCPWSYRASAPTDMAHILQLAGVYAGTSGYTNIPYGQGNTGMYPINGSTKDSNYGIMGAISWSMEISESKQPPPSQIMFYYNTNKPAMLAMIEYAGYGLEGVITDAVSGEPIAATIFVNDYLPAYTDPVVGDYHKYVLPGTYSITVKANGYENKTVSGVSVSEQSSTVTNITLDPKENHGIYKVISSRIPNNNPADPGLTWNVIGEPDNLYYSIGKGGWIVVDLQEVVFDGPGPDLMVFEGDATPEGFTFYAGETIDGPWHSMGNGAGTSEFDFIDCNIDAARYFKLTDDNDGPANTAGAGFDLDAMQVLSSITGPYIAMDGYMIDDSNGNNNGILDPGETALFVVTLKNVGTETATAISGTFTSDDEYLEILTTDPQLFGNLEVNQTAQATFQVQALDGTPAGHTATIDLEIDGTNIQPDTKFISITFPDFCYPTANCSFGDGFTGFNLENILNWDNGCSDEGYGDFSELTTELEPGESYTVMFETGYSNQDACLWIDFNNNMEFEESERLITDFNLANANQTYTTTIDIPEDVPPGEKRLRIRANWQNSAADPCANFSYGETEDYTVIITGNPLVAGFDADEWEICYGEQVQFYDMSTGEITSWEWNFAGGDPATSTLQNPLVTYTSSGFYGVTLTVSDGTNSSTQTLMECILVHDDPMIPDTPDGPVAICQGENNITYHTNPANCTDWYWEMSPSAAGSMTQTGPVIEINWNPEFHGAVQLMVAGMNNCGQSEMSEPLNIEIQPMPADAGLINGPTEVCQEDVVIYSTLPIEFANTYQWTITPQEAGTMQVSDEECTITFSDSYSGEAVINVAGLNDCGQGTWSEDFIVEVEICAAIDDHSFDTHFLIFPNPSKGIFSVKAIQPMAGKTTITVVDPLGNIIAKNTKMIIRPDEIIDFQFDNLPAGNYFLNISDSTGSFIKKIQVLR
jgi:PKD repeat protein